MFSFSGNLLAGQHDTKKHRTPPTKPIPIRFPALRPPEPSPTIVPASWGERSTGLAAHLLRVKKPSDVSPDTLALLNVTFQPECDLETFFSSISNNAPHHLPPQSWLTTVHERGDTNLDLPSQLLSNSRRAPGQQDFHIRARELTFDNGEAFSTLSRKRDGGQAPLRLAHFRKFWESLDNMAYYWDNSLDEYVSPQSEDLLGSHVSTTVSENAGVNTQTTTTETKQSRVSETQLTSPGQEEPRKKARTNVNEDEKTGSSTTSNSLSQMPTRPLPERVAPPNVPWANNMDSDYAPMDLSKGSYRGYRIGNGAEMPDQYRIDCVRAFLEPIAWAFGVTLSPHRRPPVLAIGCVRFPVRMSSVAWRGPQDRVKARQGWLEGPVLGMQCRADINFGATGKIDSESVLDAVRELGGLLLLAQERSRAGKQETRGGEGKWWTTKERWGGGPGGEVGTAANAADLQPSKVEAKSTDRNRDGSKARRKLSPAELWKILKPLNTLWDPKVTYEAIGKNETSEWDDVFMVSSLNHHISLVKLHVHPAYIQYVTEGELPRKLPPDVNWCSPKLQRTRWFDLFSIDDRIEAMRAIWGVMSYLMRVNVDFQGESAMRDAQPRTD
ncbi:hypothetical protein ACN47E_003670 [Coniothyrium glycines]